MTQTVRKRNLETSLYPLFHRKFEHNLHIKAVKMTKTAPAIAIHRGNLCQKKFTGKELDSETGLYYYGARYLDLRVSRWLSGDPAMAEYIPSAPVSDEARKRNGNLPGMGGVFNCVNLHAYHYAGNNPVKLVDPDGRAPGDSIFGFSCDPWEEFYNFWGSILGDISAFLNNKTAQNNITVKGQYYLREFDRLNVAALTTISDATSNATIFFLAVGQPEAAAITAGISLAAKGMLIAHDWVSAYYNNDQVGMNRAINDGTFLVAGLIINNVTKTGIDKVLSISTGGKTVNYMINGNRWETIQQNIRQEFGNLSGNVVEEILNAARKVYLEE